MCFLATFIWKSKQLLCSATCFLLILANAVCVMSGTFGVELSTFCFKHIRLPRTKRRIGGPFTPGLKMESKLFAVTHDARLLLSGGYWDNSLQVYRLDKTVTVNHIIRHIGQLCGGGGCLH